MLEPVDDTLAGRVAAVVAARQADERRRHDARAGAALAYLSGVRTADPVARLSVSMNPGSVLADFTADVERIMADVELDDDGDT